MGLVQEKTVHFQNPILDAINMGTVIATQDDIKDKIKLVRRAAQAITGIEGDVESDDDQELKRKELKEEKKQAKAQKRRKREYKLAMREEKKKRKEEKQKMREEKLKKKIEKELEKEKAEGD